MRLLLVCATAAELAPVASRVRMHHRHQIELLTAGVGMVPTAVRCATTLASGRFDCAINLGVCGSFDPDLLPGVVVHVVRDRLSELGVEDGETFRTLDEIGLADESIVINASPPASGALAALPRVSGITVNTVHGDPASIDSVVRRWQPQVESMEGAAFMFACAAAGVPFAQVRAVSNMVERRNRAAWKMDEAIEHLGNTALSIVESL